MLVDRGTSSQRADMRDAGDDAGFRHDRFGSALQAKAVRLHQMNRDRAMHFNQPIMADSAMDIMLTLLIGQEQNTPMSLTILALANRLNAQDCEAMVDSLAEAGLVARTGQEVAGNVTVALTDRGSSRMRGYVMDQRVA